MVDMVRKATFLVAIRLHLKMEVQWYTFQNEHFDYRIILDAYLNPRDSSFSTGNADFHVTSCIHARYRQTVCSVCTIQITIGLSFFKTACKKLT